MQYKQTSGRANLYHDRFARLLQFEYLKEHQQEVNVRRVVHGCEATRTSDIREPSEDVSHEDRAYAQRDQAYKHIQFVGHVRKALRYQRF